MDPAVVISPTPAMNCKPQSMPNRVYVIMYCSVSLNSTEPCPVLASFFISPLAYRNAIVMTTNPMNTTFMKKGMMGVRRMSGISDIA